MLVGRVACFRGRWLLHRCPLASSSWLYSLPTLRTVGTTVCGATSSWDALSTGGRIDRLHPKRINSTETRDFLVACRAQYLEYGWCHIPHFLSPRAVATLRTEAETLLADDTVAYASFDHHTVYQEEQDSSLPLDHPRNTLMRSSKKIVDYAKIGTDSLLKILYNSNELLSFVEKVCYFHKVTQIECSKCCIRCRSICRMHVHTLAVG